MTYCLGWTYMSVSADKGYEGFHFNIYKLFRYSKITGSNYANR